MEQQPIRLTLPSATVYVSGTVNGTATTWTNVEGYDWETIADRAPDDIYRVELSMVTGQGVTVAESVTLYYGLQLITDRTQADVNRVLFLAAKRLSGMTAEEQAEFSAAMRGAYNAEDLNRVGAAVAYVAQRLAAYDYAADVSPKQNWYTIDDAGPFDPDNEPTPAAMAAYLADVAAIRAALAAMPTTPSVPADMDRLTFREANDIEQILLDVDHLITNMTKSFVRCGQPACGQIWEAFT